MRFAWPAAPCMVLLQSGWRRATLEGIIGRSRQGIRMAGEQELDEALTALLELERASVEVEVALASAASEYQERAAFTAMGAEDIEACCALHERLQRSEDEVSHYISRVVFDILERERYDDRLRAFAIHQREIGRRASEIMETLGAESGARRLLHEIAEAHVRHALWAERRAEE